MPATETAPAQVKTPKIKFVATPALAVGSEVRVELKGFKFWTVYKIVNGEAYAKPSKLQTTGVC